LFSHATRKAEYDSAVRREEFPNTLTIETNNLLIYIKEKDWIYGGAGIPEVIVVTVWGHQRH